MTTHDSGAPVVDFDPYTDAALTDPYAHHEALREAGPVFYLPAYGVYGMARYAEVSAALQDHATYCSSRGVGLSDFLKEEPWRPPSLLLEVDPPLHDRTRMVVQTALNPRALKALTPTWKAAAEELVDALVARGSFDAVKDLTEVYPLRVFPDAVGIQQTGREKLIPYGALAFNAFGPLNALAKNSLAGAPPLMDWVAESCRRENLTPDGFGAAVFEAADRGEVTDDEAERLVRSFLSAGVDTTVIGMGNMLHAFARHPDQWTALRDDMSLAKRCFEEALRYDSTVQTFYRTTTREVRVGDVTIPEGEKVLLFYGAANRDPRQFENPEVFDITRRALGHLGFGVGVHNCVGQMVARMEAELVVTALAERAATFELAGDVEPRPNNTLHAIASLPVRVTRA